MSSLLEKLMLCPVILAALTIVAVPLSPQVARERGKAISLSIGLGLIIWGIKVCLDRQYSLRFLNKLTRRQSLLNVTGSAALTVGIVFISLGLALTCWGATFWGGYLHGFLQ